MQGRPLLPQLHQPLRTALPPTFLAALLALGCTATTPPSEQAATPPASLPTASAPRPRATPEQTSPTQGAPRAERPNVVLMLADNVGYGDIGAFQGGEIRGMPTPNIDRLASEGLELTQFLTEPGCTPTRAALMTGRHAHRSGLGTIIVGGTPNTLQDEEVTLAEIFKRKGYATAMTGKWHLGSEEQSWPVRQGFDEYRVGVLETSDSTLYRPNMERAGLPEEAIAPATPGIWEGDAKHGLKRVREYDLEYRRQVEGDIAKASVDFIQRYAEQDQPFFLYVGWTHTHYPSRSAPEFTGKSVAGPYGDAIMELDFRTGEVLQAIEEAGIADDTIVLWLSDDGAAPMQGPPADWGGSNGIYSGELGDGREGALRSPAMIRWPGQIAPGKSDGMISVHDIFPTLAALIGEAAPNDRPIDGIDQSAWFLGNQPDSARESLLTFLGTEIVAFRWRHFRMYPSAFVETPGTPNTSGLMGARLRSNGFPLIYNIKKDPREQTQITADNAWLLHPYLQAVAAYKETLKKYPNPPPVSLVEF